MEGENEERNSGVVSRTFNVNQGYRIEREEDGTPIWEFICGRCLNEDLNNILNAPSIKVEERYGLHRFKCCRCGEIIDTYD